MIQVSKTFDQVQPEDGEDIVDTDAAFYIWFSPQHIRGSQSIREGKLHLVGVDQGIVVIAQTAIQDLAANDLAQPESFQSGDLIKKEPVKVMVDIDAGIVVAHEFPDIHQVIGIIAIEIGLVAGMDDE